MASYWHLCMEKEYPKKIYKSRKFCLERNFVKKRNLSNVISRKVRNMFLLVVDIMIKAGANCNDRYPNYPYDSPLTDTLSKYSDYLHSKRKCGRLEMCEFKSQKDEIIIRYFPQFIFLNFSGNAFFQSLRCTGGRWQ